MQRAKVCAWAVVFASLLGAPDAQGQARGDAKKEAKERRDDRKESADGGTSTGRDAAVPDPSDVLPPPKPEAAKKDKAERRRRAVGLIRARWGALVLDSAVQAELRLHARRTARIEAMEQVARTSGKTALLPRIAELKKKEVARFEKRMQWLKDGEHKDGG